jgi:uncharacterized membrane protein YczE
VTVHELAARIAHFIRPSRTIPRTPWTAHGRWSLTPARFMILVFGLSIFGFGDAFLIQSKIGNSPWTVLAQGVSKHAGISIGWSTFLISILILLIWIPMRERPGFGTLANVVVIAASIQLGISIIPMLQHGFFWQIGYVLLGIALIGMGSAFYITCGLGPGPRDGLMTSIHKKTGIRIGRVRLTIEVTVFTLGALLGGRIGIGTALFALLIGNSVALGFTVLHRLAPTH